MNNPKVEIEFEEKHGTTKLDKCRLFPAFYSIKKMEEVTDRY